MLKNTLALTATGECVKRASQKFQKHRHSSQTAVIFGFQEAETGFLGQMGGEGIQANPSRSVSVLTLEKVKNSALA